MLVIDAINKFLITDVYLKKHKLIISKYSAIIRLNLKIAERE